MSWTPEAIVDLWLSGKATAEQQKFLDKMFQPMVDKTYEIMKEQGLLDND